MIGPYEGYLLQVTQDYFLTKHGLRGTHNGVFDGMDEQLREDVKPYLPDTKPGHPKLLGELHRATYGAWFNYVGDLNNWGDASDRSARRNMALRGTLTMGMLAASEAAVRAIKEDVDPLDDEQRITTTNSFFDDLRVALTDDAMPQVGADAPVAVRLAGFMNHRFRIGENEALRGALGGEISTIAGATEAQLRTPRSDMLAFMRIATTLGKTTAWFALDNLRHAGVYGKQPNVDEGAQKAAECLGMLGGVLRHGHNIEAAVRWHLPTYATARIREHGGATSAAMLSIKNRREDQTEYLIDAGRHALTYGGANKKQLGIYNMAAHLLVIKEDLLAHTDSPRDIDNLMYNDPFWQLPTH